MIRLKTNVTKLVLLLVVLVALTIVIFYTVTWYEQTTTGLKRKICAYTLGEDIDSVNKTLLKCCNKNNLKSVERTKDKIMLPFISNGKSWDALVTNLQPLSNSKTTLLCNPTDFVFDKGKLVYIAMVEREQNAEDRDFIFNEIVSELRHKYKKWEIESKYANIVYFQDSKTRIEIKRAVDDDMYFYRYTVFIDYYDLDYYQSIDYGL